MPEKIPPAWVIWITVFVIGGVGAYFYWTTTVPYAFVEAGMAIKSHDINKFRESVDLNSLVSSGVDQLMVQPVHTTGGLTQLQTEVVNHVMESVARKTHAKLLSQAERYVAADRAVPVVGAVPPGGFMPAGTPLPGSAPAGLAANVAPGSAGAPPFATSSAPLVLPNPNQDQGIKAQLKAIGLRRVQDFAATRPDSLLCKLVRLPREERTNELRRLLEENGFTPASFASFSTESVISRGGEDFTVASVYFHKPNSQDLSVIKVSLTRTSPFGHWCIREFVDLREAIGKIDPGYQNDVHDMVRYTVADVSAIGLETKVKSVVRSAVSVIKSFARNDLGISGSTVDQGVSEAGAAIKNSDLTRSLAGKWRRFQIKMDSPGRW